MRCGPRRVVVEQGRGATGGRAVQQGESAVGVAARAGGGDDVGEASSGRGTGTRNGVSGRFSREAGGNTYQQSVWKSSGRSHAPEAEAA